MHVCLCVCVHVCVVRVRLGHYVIPRGVCFLLGDPVVNTVVVKGAHFCIG